MTDTTDRKAIAEELMETLRAQAADPQTYVLHAIHQKVMLAGVMSAAKLLRSEKADDYFYFALDALEPETNLREDGARLMALPGDEALKELEKLLARKAADPANKRAVRYNYLGMLRGVQMVTKSIGLTGWEEAEAAYREAERACEAAGE